MSRSSWLGWTILGHLCLLLAPAAAGAQDCKVTKLEATLNNAQRGALMPARDFITGADIMATLKVTFLAGSTVTVRGDFNIIYHVIFDADRVHPGGGTVAETNIKKVVTARFSQSASASGSPDPQTATFTFDLHTNDIFNAVETALEAAGGPGPTYQNVTNIRIRLFNSDQVTFAGLCETHTLSLKGKRIAWGTNDGGPGVDNGALAGNPN